MYKHAKTDTPQCFRFFNSILQIANIIKKIDSQHSQPLKPQIKQASAKLIKMTEESTLWIIKI